MSLGLEMGSSLTQQAWWWTGWGTGNMVVADSRNHRLCLYSQEGKFLCKVKLSPETRRPSGVVLDTENRELYVLNLHGREAMTKYKIK